MSLDLPAGGHLGWLQQIRISRLLQLVLQLTLQCGCLLLMLTSGRLARSRHCSNVAGLFLASRGVAVLVHTAVDVPSSLHLCYVQFECRNSLYILNIKFLGLHGLQRPYPPSSLLVSFLCGGGCCAYRVFHTCLDVYSINTKAIFSFNTKT